MSFPTIISTIPHHISIGLKILSREYRNPLCYTHTFAECTTKPNTKQDRRSPNYHVSYVYPPTISRFCYVYIIPMTLKIYLIEGTFEVFTTVKIRIEVFWVVTLCSVVVGYQRFGGPCCLHLQGGSKVLRNSGRRRTRPVSNRNLHGSHRCIILQLLKIRMALPVVLYECEISSHNWECLWE
jgi:hypothetical protein